MRLFADLRGKRFVRRAWAVGLAAAGFSAGLAGSDAGAEAAVSGFQAFTVASSARVSYIMPDYLVSEIFDAAAPMAQASLEDVGGQSFASLPYPGTTVGGYGQFVGLTGHSAPSYPFSVAADQTSPENGVADPSGAYGLRAKASATEAFGEAKLRPSGSETLTVGSLSRSSVTASGDTVVAKAESLVEGLTVGPLRLASVASQSVTTLKAGEQPVTVTELRLDGGQVGDQAFSFGPEGLQLTEFGVPVPVGEGVATLNQTLAPAGLSIRFLTPEQITGGARSGAFEVISVHNSPLGSEAVLSVRFGEVISGIVTAESVPVETPSAGDEPPSAEISPAPGGSTESDGSALVAPAAEPPAEITTPLDGRSVGVRSPVATRSIPTIGHVGDDAPDAEDSHGPPIEVAAPVADDDDGTAALVPSGDGVGPVARANRAAARVFLGEQLATASAHRVFAGIAVGGLLVVLLSLFGRKGVQRWIS